MPKIIIKDGVRYPEAFASRHGLKGEEREVGAERVRTTTAVGFQAGADGTLITSAANPGTAPVLTAAEKKAAAAAEKKAAEEKAAAEKAAAEKAAADKAAGQK